MRFFTDNDGNFSWAAITGVGTAVMAFAAVLTLWTNDTSKAKEPDTTNQTRPVSTQEYTAWTQADVQFDSAPANVTLCRTARQINVTVDAVNRQVMVDGEVFLPEEPREISETCILLNYQLADNRDRFSGGALYYKYREEK